MQVSPDKMSGPHVSQLSVGRASVLRLLGTLRHPYSGAQEGLLKAITENLIRPLQALRLHYIPLLMIYFAQGAIGLIAVAQTFWIRESLTLSAADLAAIAVWLTLPWTVKMVFGEFVDTIPLFGSQRRSYVFLGATCTASGLIILAGAAGRWLTFMHPDQLYVLGSLLIVTGTVIQDVVADAMSTEVVARTNPDGTKRPDADVRADLGMVQVLGRLSLLTGVLVVSGASGWLAAMVSREMAFLVSLVVPVISVTGVLLIRAETTERRPIDWRILGGGLVFGVVVVTLGLVGLPLAQEIIFLISMGVVCTMLVLVTRALDHDARIKILFTAIIIFAFRSSPGAGEGWTWFSIDVLKFDEAFFGVLGQIGAFLSIAALWLLAKQITEYSIVKTLLWVTVIGTVLSLPSIGLYYGIQNWTEEHFGFGAHSIAVINTAAASPFGELSFVPLLALTAFYAPAGHRATWFALMASLMNLALLAGQLQTKYLNTMFHIDRGEYGELGMLLIVATVVGFAVPMLAILLFGRRV
jgi:hypothetical protein